jgi:hypothetical protein
VNFRNGDQGLRAINVGAFLLEDNAEIAFDLFGYLPLSFGFHIGETLCFAFELRRGGFSILD